MHFFVGCATCGRSTILFRNSLLTIHGRSQGGHCYEVSCFPNLFEAAGARVNVRFVGSFFFFFFSRFTINGESHFDQNPISGQRHASLEHFLNMNSKTQKPHSQSQDAS